MTIPTALTRLPGITHPVVLAPMGGVAGRPDPHQSGIGWRLVVIAGTLN